jgi:site-specific recombinase XerD
MTALEVVDAYLAARRALGVRLEREGRYLHQFVRETDNMSLAEITAATIASFLRGRTIPTATWRVKRASLAGLYRYAISHGLVGTSPLPEHPPKLAPQQTPYVYSTEELQRLLKATAVLEHPTSRLRAMSYRTLLLLLYGAGLRVGEAIALTVSNVDLVRRLITIQDTKFYKTRVVPIGPRLTRQLATYLDRRRLWALPQGEMSAFLCSRTGHGFCYQDVITTFQRIRSAAGITCPPGEPRPPRLHDLRHTAAVHRVLAWYRADKNVQCLLPRLATYLGHADIRSTQRYLQMTPELLHEASRRFAQYAGQEVPHDRP